MNTFKRLLKLKRNWLLLLGPLAAVLLVISKHNAWFAEYIFARGIYKVYSQLLSSVTGLLPFSLAEIGIVFGVFLVPAIIIWRIVVIIKGKGEHLYRFFREFISLLCIVSIVVFMLFMGCSINYYRYSFADLAGLTIRESSAEELYALCTELVEKTNSVRAELTLEDSNQVFKLAESEAKLAKKCSEAFKELAKTYPIMAGLYPKTKLVIHSYTMSRTELTGIYVPFTMEANVNIDVPDYSIASTMCHELAHLRGFIREDEANYISYLACMASGDKELQYSGLVEALILSGNALAGKSPELYREIRGACSDAVNRDLAANSEYWKQFENTPVSNASTAANNAYLIANNQQDGVQSYGRMVDLLLAEYRKNHGID